MYDWQAIASIMLDAAGDQAAELGRAVWVQVLAGPSPEEFALAVSSEADPLYCCTAPPECMAVGVVATGRLESIDEPPPERLATDLIAATESADKLRLSCVVGRDGVVGWKMRIGTREMTEPPECGRLLDSLRRCIGLDTPPPPTDTSLIVSAAWLGLIWDAGERSRAKLTWSEVTQLHPLARILAGDVDDITDRMLRCLTKVAGCAWTWEDLRRHVADGTALLGIAPELASWMDDGMFAREVLSQIPPAEALLRETRPFLVSSASRRLAHTIRTAECWVAEAPAV